MAPRATWLTALLHLLMMAACAGRPATAAAVQKCPARQIDMCLFVFQGHASGVPTFTLPLRGDTAFSPVVVDTVTGRAIEVDATGPGSFLCVPPSQSPGTQFYLSGGAARVYARTFNKPAKAFFESRCVVLPIAAANIPGVGNLNANQDTRAYPIARRCVVFRTAPLPPAAGACNATAAAPVPRTPPCVNACPANPGALCAFYFAGHRGATPVLHLAAAAVAHRDVAVSPVIMSLATGAAVEVDQTGPGTFLSCPNAAPALKSPAGQFYVTGSPGRVYARTFQRQPGVAAFEDQCVVLPLTDIQVTVGGKFVNLRPGDGNRQFPEAKRCVAFRTAA